MVNLDTHVLIHALQGGLTSGERSLLTRNRWSVSAIVLWEIAKLVHWAGSKWIWMTGRWSGR